MKNHIPKISQSPKARRTSLLDALSAPVALLELTQAAHTEAVREVHAQRSAADSRALRVDVYFPTGRNGSGTPTGRAVVSRGGRRVLLHLNARLEGMKHILKHEYRYAYIVWHSPIHNS